MEKVLVFFHEDDGVTAIEYALIAALIAVALIATLNALGTSLKATFAAITAQLK